MSETLRRRELLARGAAAAGSLAVGGTLAACGAGSKSTGAPVGAGGRSIGGGKDVALLTFGVEGDATSMDYTQSYDWSSLLVTPSMTEALLRMNSAGGLSPNLATSYDVSDPSRVVFKIRPGVHFHDGSPLTAEDAAFSMSRHLDPDVASLLGFYYKNVDHVAATGPLEVTAFMKQPDVQFLYAMSTNAGAVASKAFIQKHGKRFGSPEAGTMGTGAYRFVSWIKGQSFTVERNPDYWNGRLVPRKVQRFTVHVITDEGTLVTALRAGQIDGQLAQLSGRGVQSLASVASLRQYAVPSGGASHMNLNLARKPWDDQRVRRALSLVIPRQGLIDSVWGGNAQLVKSIVPPSMWSYARPTFAAAYAALPDYIHTQPAGANLTEARKLISQAGAHGAKGAIMVATPSDAQQAQAIQAAASQIGLDLTVDQVTQAQSQAAGTASHKTFDMTITFGIPDLPDPANLLALCYTSGSNVNWSGYKSAQVDAWLRQQNNITNDPQKRAELLTKVQATVMREQFDAMLVGPDLVLTLNKRLGGYQFQSPQWQWDGHLIGSISGT